MNYHRRWAGRRAWRVRALLAALLALAAWELRPWFGGWALLLPLLALSYPARREEARALGEIDRRVGLVYRTALETPAADPRRRRLAAAANRAARRAGLPRFPWVELLLAACLWTAAAFLPAPAPAARTVPSLASGGSKALKRDGESKRTDQPGPKSDAPARQGGQESAEPAARPAGKPSGEAENETAKDSGKVSPKATGREQKAGDDESAARQPTKETTGSKQPGGNGGAAGREAEEATPPTAGKKPAAEGLRVEGRPTTDAASAAAAGGKAGGPAATAAGQPKVVSPSPEAKTNELPSPWAGGKPPAAVRHAAESYIRNNPLPPGAAEALRRYFDLEQ